MDIQFELIISAKLLASLVLGCIIGLEREREQKNAGIRTFGCICVSSCLFIAIATHLTDDTSAIARILAAIATGLSFIGAGLIFKERNEYPKGLTTTTSLWGTSAVGASIALNMFVLACTATALIYLLLTLNKYKWYAEFVKKISSDKRDDETINHNNNNSNFLN